MLIVFMSAFGMVAFAAWKLFLKKRRDRRRLRETKVLMNARYGKGSL